MATISRTVLREQVKDVLLQRIASGELKPGERLVETRIAQELGTSQAPVREALRDLQLMRLVESEPFRGSRVRVVDEEEVMEVFPVRASLEELAARLAAERLDGDVSALEFELEAMKEAVRANDTNALAQHDIAFHRLVVEAAGNSVLEQCWKSLGVESRITISLYGVYMEPTQAAERHVKLIDAIRDRNPAAAAREARKHVEVSAKLMRSPSAGGRRVTVVLAVTWVAKEGESDAVAEILAQAIPLSRAEPGCLQYDVHRDRDDPNRFFLFERYVDEAALEAHGASPHFQELVIEGGAAAARFAGAPLLDAARLVRRASTGEG